MAIICVIGRLGKDPDVKFTENGKMYVNISVAENEYIKGEVQTIWHNAKAWGKKAEYIGNNFCKGDNIYLEGITKQFKNSENKRVFHFIEINKVKKIFNTKERSA